MRCLRMCSAVVNLILFIGFAMQNWYILMEYLSYKTVSNIAPVILTDHIVPNWSLCFSLTSIISQESVNASASGRQFFDDQSAADNILTMTTDKIFAVTPSANDLIDMCSFTSHLLGTKSKHLRREKCLEYFSVLKYQMLGYMCYRMSVRGHENIKIDLETVANSLDDKHTLFSMSLYHRDFTQGPRKYLPVIHVSDFPYESRQFAMEYLSSPSFNDSFKANFDLVIAIRLPPPYETMCRDPDPTGCYYTCLSQATLPLKMKLAETILTDDQVELKIVTNSQENDAVKSIKEKCQHMCGRDACFQDYTVTSLVLQPVSQHRLSFELVTMNPVVQIICTAHMVLCELLTIIGCLFGIWFAASVLGLGHLVLTVMLGSKKRKWSRRLSSKLIVLASSVDLLKKKCYGLRRTLQWRGNLRCMSPQSNKSGCSSQLKHRKLLVVAFNFVTTALFIYHLFTVNSLYFAYKTIFKLTREISECEAEELKLVVCFDVHDMMNWPYPTIPNQYNFPGIMNSNNWTDYTLEEMFEKQYPYSKVLNSCAVRNSATNRLQFYSSFSQCIKYFDIVTMYMFNRMCYRITPKFTLSLRYSKLRSAFTDAFVIYSVTSDFSEWTGAHEIRPIIFVSGHIPLFSRDFAGDIYVNGSNRTYVMTYSSYLLHLLAYPYDSNCVSRQTYILLNSNKCIIEGATKQLGYLPHSQMYNKPLNEKFLSYKLLKNSSISSVYEKLQDHCARVSRDLECEDSFMKTISSIEYITSSNLTFVVRTPIYTTLHATAQPLVTLFRFIFDSACCFSFYFGLSIVFFNPFTHLILRSRRKMTNLVMKKLNETYLQVRKVFSFLGTISSRHVHHSKSVSFACSSSLRSRKMKTILCLNVVLVLCCSLHLVYLLKNYFAYYTIINSYMSVEKLNIIPSSILCLQTDQVIQADVSRPLTISKVFAITPKAKSFLSTCGGRGLPIELRPLYPNISSYVLDRLYLEDSEGHDCVKFFEVNKFLMNDNVCYNMKYRKTIEDSQTGFRSFKYPGLLYNFGFNNNHSFHSFMLIVNDGKPYTSRLFTFKMKSSRSTNVWVSLSYIKFSSQCLPFPYDQHDYPDMEFDECISHCTGKLTEKSGLIFPFVVVDDAKSNFSIVDSTLMSQGKVKDQFKRVYTHCKNKCQFHRECTRQFSYFLTTAYVAGEWPGLSFWLKKTDYPVTKIKFNAKMRLCDLILEAGNIIGIWLGLCVLHMNFFKLLTSHDQGQLSDGSSEGEMVQKLSDIEKHLNEANELFNAKRMFF